MKCSDPLPRQNDALRAAVPISMAKSLPAQNIDLVIQTEERKKLLMQVAPLFLTPDEFKVITRKLNLDGRGCQSGRAIATDLQISLSTVMNHERVALEKIHRHLDKALAAYQQRNSIEHRARLNVYA